MRVAAGVELSINKIVIRIGPLRPIKSDVDTEIPTLVVYLHGLTLHCADQHWYAAVAFQLTQIVLIDFSQAKGYV